ncbi:HAD hydrolase-like protein [Sphaerochaeta sp.]|uniref:HAD hydrolase-like protein n=1 Tax=Sphaerochaeta sp. TaxID=1972642 RepID=UPI002FC8E6FF
MKKYDLAIFDLDGTILDTSEGLLSALTYTIVDSGYPIPPLETLNTFIGPPVQESFSKAFGVSGETLKRMSDIFRERYKNEDLLLAKPYEGIYEVLQYLIDQGVKIAIATYKREDYALKLLKHYSFDRYSSIMHGSDFAGLMKKHDIISLCVAESEVKDFRRVVMIGDTYHDALGAEQLGIDFIGVTYGFGYTSVESIVGTRIIGCAEKPSDIIKFIK